MLLTIPFVLGVDDSPDKNSIRQITARSGTFEGTLSTFKRDRLRGWLFQPPDAEGSILIVPPRTKLDRIPAAYTRVLAARLDEASECVDLSAAEWLRHPRLHMCIAHDVVRDSWLGAFSYVEADENRGIVGLRPPQIGAVHVWRSHSTSIAPLSSAVMLDADVVYVLGLAQGTTRVSPGPVGWPLIHDEYETNDSSRSTP